MATTDAPTQPRKRGSRAGIDRSRIVAAAQGMDPTTLTMQAVADRLGVDRKALHHHVADRDGLLKLIAATCFDSAFDGTELPLNGPWQQVATRYASMVRSGMLATGSLYDYVRFDPSPEQPAFAAVESLLTSLLAAGFADEAAGRALTVLTQIAVISARDEVVQDSDGHPQYPELRRALDDAPDDAYTILRRVASTPPAYDEAQFHFALRTLISGLEAELSKM